MKLTVKLRATPDMDTRDCEYVNARIAELLAALRVYVERDEALVNSGAAQYADLTDLRAARAAIAKASQE